MSKKSKAQSIYSRTVAKIKEETKPAANFCIAMSSVPIEVIRKKKRNENAKRQNNMQ
jgi:hypothetical protein